MAAQMDAGIKAMAKRLATAKKQKPMLPAKSRTTGTTGGPSKPSGGIKKLMVQGY